MTADSYQISVSTGSEAPISVDCGTDQTLLDAFLRNGVYLANSCNQGTCGTCKVRLVHGVVDCPDISDTVLGDADRAAGYVLACQSRPCAESAIAVDSADSTTGPRHRLVDRRGTVTELDVIATDTVAVVVDIDEPLEFSAGQYVELAIPGSAAWRPYSMANPPSQNHRLEFHVRRVPGGAATDKWIFTDLSVGDEVHSRGPWGDFVHVDDTDERLLLLGGGTGLAPLKSIALQALSENPERQIDVYHGVRYEDDLYDVDFWTDASRDHVGLTYTPCLSRGDWSGRTGYVGDAVLADFGSLRGHRAYLCGPPEMVDAGVKACKRRRMPSRNIHREKYTSAADAVINLSA